MASVSSPTLPITDAEIPTSLNFPRQAPTSNLDIHLHLFTTRRSESVRIFNDASLSLNNSASDWQNQMYAEPGPKIDSLHHVLPSLTNSPLTNVRFHHQWSRLPLCHDSLRTLNSLKTSPLNLPFFLTIGCCKSRVHYCRYRPLERYLRRSLQPNLRIPGQVEYHYYFNDRGYGSRSRNCSATYRV